MLLVAYRHVFLNACHVGNWSLHLCLCFIYKSSNMIEKEYFMPFKNITAIFVNSCPPICFVKLQRFEFLMPFLVPVAHFRYCWFQLNLIPGGRRGKAQVKPGLCFREHNPWTTFSLQQQNTSWSACLQSQDRKWCFLPDLSFFFNI